MPSLPQHLMPTPADVALLTDLYELTMAAGFHRLEMNEPACFELFVRALPPERNFLIAAGLEQAVAGVRDFGFNVEQIDFLRSLPAFGNVSASFFDRLAGLRFTGDLWAMPEGTVVFPDEPLVQVVAPLIEAQLLETFLITTLNYQTMVASKAARVVHAAAGRSVVDFGSRRAHGPQAGLLAARATFLAGCTGTSNVEAARRLNIPPVGTQAHSWIMAFDSEQQAFRAYAETFGAHCVLLIDTYDTLEGARRAGRIEGELAGVRLDSGDLVALSKQVRRILDDAGRTAAKIVASSDLNEYTIARLLAAGAPIDVFGVGTEMVTSFDRPALPMVYKLVEIRRDGRWRPRVKKSAAKATLPGRKQVFRFRDDGGTFAHDVLGLHGRDDGGEPLLREIFRGGDLVTDLPDVHAIRQRAADQRAALSRELLDIRRRAEYPVHHSEALGALCAAGSATDEPDKDGLR